MKLLGSKGEEVHWKDELCCEEKGSRRPGIQSSQRGGGQEGKLSSGEQLRGEEGVERKGGTALSRQAGCLGCRYSLQTAFSPGISPLPMVRIKPGALSMLGKYSTTELYS